LLRRTLQQKLILLSKYQNEKLLQKKNSTNLLH